MLARELQELKADLTIDTQELSETEEAYQANLRQAKVAQQEFQDKIGRLEKQLSQVKIKEAQAEAATALSSVAFKVGDLGDTMKTVEDVLQKRYEVSAGKARVARDMVDMAAVQEKESERKALEQTALAEFLASQGMQATPGARRDRHAVGQGNGAGQMSDQQQRFTALGKLVSILLVAGLIALGVYMIRRGDTPCRSRRAPPAGEAAARRRSPRSRSRCRSCRPPGPVQIKDNIVPIEISEYAGYAGLIAANGGLEPTENSVFFKNHGFKVRLTVSEGENWSALNEGKLAASVTTADVLAVYGRQLHAIVPAQIGFSRGADGLVVRSDIKRINALKGKTIATAQFTEVDFFIRYLAQEAGLAVNALGSLDSAPHPDRVNVVYTEDGFAAGDLFLSPMLKSGRTGWPAA